MAREVIDQQVLVWDGVLLSPTLTGLFKNWFLNPLLLLLLSVGSSVAVIYVRYMTVDMNMGHNKLIKMYEKKMQHYQYLLADKQHHQQQTVFYRTTNTQSTTNWNMFFLSGRETT